MTARGLFTLCVVGFGLFLGVSAQGLPAPGLTVTYVHGTLTLQINHPTDLAAVLEVVCQQTQTRCEIAPEVAQVVVQPTALSGTWPEVLAKLFEGERVNYATLGAGPAGRLVVKVRRAAPPAPYSVGGSGAHGSLPSTPA